MDKDRSFCVISLISRTDKAYIKIAGDITPTWEKLKDSKTGEFKRLKYDYEYECQEPQPKGVRLEREI